MGVTFRVLGPLQALRDERDVTPAAGKQRTVLATLVLAAGRTVPLHRLIDEVWGEAPIGTARKSIHVYVARLRDTLGDDVIVTTGSGYRVDPHRSTVDLAEFDAAVLGADAAAAVGDVERAVRSLRAGLELWRGEPLANVPSAALRQRVVPGLVERRLQAVERCCELEVGLGRAADVVVELRRLVDEYPLRERLWVSLMRALHAAGRQADALAAYDEAAAMLADELGVDPGEELRQTHQAILTQTCTVPGAEVVVAEVPRQLPARPAGFVGRHEQVDQLVSWLDDPGATPVAVVSGPPGVGKTAVAVTAAHRSSERFPDGQLFVDVRGFSAERELTPYDILPRFLRALGIPGDETPVDVDEQAALYRSRMSGRRMLVVVDNAASTDVVRPLLPGAPGSAVLVTSRNDLHQLVALDGARMLSLDVLSLDEARLAVAEQLGGQRVAAEPAAVERLTRLCGRLPLALRVAGANLATHPHYPIDDYITDLDRGGRLLGFWSSADESLVTAAFATSYAALDDATRSVFRLLGLVPGSDVTADAVAALTGNADARRSLDALTAASLVDRHAPGRYRMHDLIREYARHRADCDDDPAATTAARRRLFAWYTATVDAILVPLLPGYYRLGRPPTEVGTVVAPDVDWIDSEFANLTAAVDDAARDGLPESAWHLADALRPYLETRARYAEWSAVVEVSLAAAERDGDARAQAAMCVSAGTLSSLLGDIDEAVRLHERAQRLYAEAEPAGEAVVWQNLSVIQHMGARLDEAHAACERALEVSLRNGDTDRFRRNLHNLAHLAAEMGRFDAALADLEQVREFVERLGDSKELAMLHFNLGVAHRCRGDVDAAIAHQEECRRIAVADDLHADVVDAYVELARCRCDRGEYQQARTEASAGVQWAVRVGLHRNQLEARVALFEAIVWAGRPAVWIDQLEQLAGEHALDRVRILARALDVLAWAHVFRGDHAEALAVAERGLQLGKERSLRLAEDAAFTVATAALVGLGKVEEAVEHGIEALRRHSETGYRLRKARTLCYLGDAYRDRDDGPAAVDCWRQARDLYTAIGTAEVAGAERRLRQAGT